MSTQEKVDVIDQLLQLDPQGSTFAARHFRSKVLHGTQDSYDALFSPRIGLDLGYRWLVALYAAHLSKATELTQHYMQKAEEYGVSAANIQAVITDRLSDITEPQLVAALTFTQILIKKPLEGDQAALKALQQAGIATKDIVALSQLIAFLSYQVRLVAGLKAMQSVEAV